MIEADSLESTADERVCPRCGEARSAGEFGGDRSKPSGRRSVCRPCDRAQAARYYGANRGKVLERMAAKREAKLAARLSELGVSRLQARRRFYRPGSERE